MNRGVQVRLLRQYLRDDPFVFDPRRDKMEWERQVMMRYWVDELIKRSKEGGNDPLWHLTDIRNMCAEVAIETNRMGTILFARQTEDILTEILRYFLIQFTSGHCDGITMEDVEDIRRMLRGD